MTNILARLIIFNFTVACGVAAATWEWPIIQTFKADASPVPYAIIAMFLYGLVNIFIIAIKGKEKFAHTVDLVGYLAMTGLFGTVVGMMIALHNFHTGADSSSFKTTIDTVLAGIGTLFLSTGVGIITSMWHHLNCRIVSNGK